jgi:hypothetical protein
MIFATSLFAKTFMNRNNNVPLLIVEAVGGYFFTLILKNLKTRFYTISYIFWKHQIALDNFYTVITKVNSNIKCLPFPYLRDVLIFCIHSLPIIFLATAHLFTMFTFTILWQFYFPKNVMSFFPGVNT